jgi:peptidoglycan/LPS O-acetylase OafA/YrhL
VQGDERRATIPHVTALDGARGAAVAGVLLFHGGHLRGGYLGVDLFFALSGFLITSLLLAESGRTGSVGLGGFWARRARRLLPALAVLLVWIAVYGAVFATRQELTQIRYDALATLAYGANWRSVFSHQSYWALFSAPSPLRHAWSLAIEEQFYLVWPLIFVGLLARWKRNTPRAVFVTALVLAGVSSVLMLVLYDPTSTARVYYGTDTRVAAILLGAALAAWLAMTGPTRYRVALEALGLVGAGVLALAWIRLDGQSVTLYRGGFLACGLCATAVIATVVHPEPGLLSRVLSLRPLCGLGLISYGVYLYHWPIDVVLDEKRVGLGGWPLFAVQTSVTLAVAIASYRFIEQPVRRGAFSSYQWRLLTPALSAGLVGALLAGTAGALAPLGAVGFSDPVAPVGITRKDAYKTAAPGARRVLLVGNSVAYLLGPPMATIHSDPPLAVFDAALPSCTFVPSTRIRAPLGGDGAAIVGSRSCHPSSEVGVVKRFHPDVVLWVMSGPPSALWHDGHWLQPCTPTYAATFRARLRGEVARLGAGGAKVVITTAAYSRYVFHGSDSLIRCENPLRREVAAATGAQLVDLFAYICPHGQCREKQDGVVLRPDGLHYRDAGGRIVARWLIDQVDPSGRQN